MRTRLLSGLTLICLLTVAWPAPAAEEKGLPSFVVRLKSIDGLMDDFSYLGKLADKENETKQLLDLFKSATGEKGLEGIDTKKPIGLYGQIGPAGTDSDVVVMVPVADEKAFLDLLARFEVKADKGTDGVYTVINDQLKQQRQEVFFRFANKYAYATLNNKKNIATEKLLAPAVALPAEKIGTFSLVLNIDQIPDKLKDVALGQTELQLGNIKDEKAPGETDAQHNFRTLAADESMKYFKSLLKDGQELTVRFDIDQKAADISLSMSLTGAPGSKLAKEIADLGTAKSIGAGLIGSDSAMNLLAHMLLTDNLRKGLEPVIDEGFKKAIAAETDKAKQAAAEKMLKVLAPTFKSGELDLGMNLRGPSANGQYAGVFGVKVKDGMAMEKTIKDIIKDLPEAEKKDIKLDAEKFKDVNIHRINPGKDYTEDAKKLFGDNPVYIAFRDDALFLTLGDGGLEAIKEAIGGQAKASKMLQVELAMGRIAQLMVKEQPGAVDAAKKAFGKTKDNDRLTLTLEGGKAFKLRAGMKAQLVTFFVLLAEAQQKKAFED